jgi:arylsulfatase
VVVVLGCTVRRDRMGVYGHRESPTPFLDELARKGVAFEHVFAQAPWTRPSMGALVTGRWPRVLQLEDPSHEHVNNRALADGFTTLAEVFSSHGYRTLGSTANTNVNRIFGFAQGFDVYEEPENLWRDKWRKVRGTRVSESFSRAVQRMPADVRLFGRLVFVDTHFPRPPVGGFQNLIGKLRERDMRRRLDVYDASLGELDAVLARLFVSLHERRRNLLFVFAADHGEGLALPEHHGIGHGNYLYRTTTEIPWIVHHPGLADPGRRIGGVAMAIDLHPTLLGLLGITPDHALDGESWASAVRGELRNAGRELAFSETFYLGARKSAVFDGSWHLIRDHDPPQQRRGSDLGERGSFELYRAADVAERRDLWHGERQGATELAAALRTWELEMDEREAAAGAPFEIDPSPSTLEELRALGYAK